MSRADAQIEKWTGSFGKEYTDRNVVTLDGLEELYKKCYGITRTELNGLFLKKISRSARILEVGCNVGNQLLCLKKMGFENLYGIEPQDYAVKLSQESAGGINIIRGNAFDIPFKDSYFDIVFTAGVLIHIHPGRVKKAMKEIYRCTRKYIWGFEYYSDEYKEVVYRGRKNLLWKADFSKLYMDLFDDLTLMKEKRIKYLDNKNIDMMFLLEKGGK